MRFLRGCGHDVRYAPDGHEALALVSDSRPDLVLLDLLMPKMDGVSFLRVLRSYLGWQHLPVVVLTAHPDGPEAKRAAALNTSRVVCKGSVDLPDLGVIVEQQLHDGGDVRHA